MDNLSALMHQRRSIRKYTDATLSPELIRELMTAALMAPSSKRSTPWEFILVDDPEIKAALGRCRAANSAFVEKAPLIVVVVADTEKTDVWVEDASIAASYLQLQVAEKGLGSCWVQLRLRQTAEGVPTEDYVRSLLNLPEKFGVLCMVAIGYKNEEKQPFDDGKMKWEKLHKNQYSAD